jgi:5-formyltetrahydrofolate cyclo-ligase
VAIGQEPVCGQSDTGAHQPLTDSLRPSPVADPNAPSHAGAIGLNGANRNGVLPQPPSGPPPAPGTSRRELRAARRRLSPDDQRRHTRALTRLLSRHPWFLRARRIAAFWPADGELDPRPLLELAIGRGRRGFLPALRPGTRRKLWFLPYRPGAPLGRNRLGIPEPRSRRRPALAWTLDLILVPLVGFDADGNRLGMGGGFYDRTLGFLRWRTHWHRPRLIGIAHACQRVARIDPRPWDVPLDAVATECKVYSRGRTQRIGSG